VDELDLLDWKRHIAELYAVVRGMPEPMRAWTHWCSERRRLFRDHPQSPIPGEDRAGYEGPHVFAYDRGWRLLAEVERADDERFDLPSSDGQSMSFRRFGVAHADDIRLDLYWLESYGGGLFVPFADATSGRETYGAGRYILDTVKGADLGTADGRLVLDLNFAYQPSCSYDSRWLCPLAPPANRINRAVTAGERLAAA
jgi:uncharacterized protein